MQSLVGSRRSTPRQPAGGLGVAAVGVDLAGLDAVLLAALVQHRDGFVGGCHQQHVIAGLTVLPPGVDGGSFHLSCRTAMQAIMRVVDLEDIDVALSETQACVAFPLVGEAVDAVEFDRPERVSEQPEHPAAADGGELQRVTDESDPPLATISQDGE